MSDPCKICGEPPDQWPDGDLEQHLVETPPETHEPEEIYFKYDDKALAERIKRLREERTPEAKNGAEGDDDESGNRRLDGDVSDGTPVSGGPRKPDASWSSILDRTAASRQKWFMIGVGGAGNRLVDAVLKRHKSLVDSDDESANVWESGLGGWLMLNTNDADLAETFYVDEMGYEDTELHQVMIIGRGEHGYDGAGRAWSNAHEWANADFADGDNPFTERWGGDGYDWDRVLNAQAILLLHSVTKGTGCGATPVIANKLRTKLEEAGVDPTMYSATILPKEQHFSANIENGAVGFCRITQAADAIIPFNNDELADSAGIGIDYGDHGKPNPVHKRRNKAFVSFLELFTSSSVKQHLGSVYGDDFDVMDPYVPFAKKYSEAYDADRTPGVVLAPALGKTDNIGGSAEETFHFLATSALQYNPMADFDPSTAWGGNFVVVGPQRHIEDLHRQGGELVETLEREEFLDSADTHDVDTYTHFLYNEHLDDVYLWCTLANPKMDRLNRMRDRADSLRDSSQQEASYIESIWGNHVEPLFEHLGRENIP
jgi:hypothetical protein